MELNSLKIKTPKQHATIKNLVRDSCFQIHVPMVVAARDIHPGEQLLVDYTAGAKNKYLLTQNQLDKLSKDGIPFKVSPCLNPDGTHCKCSRFFITSYPKEEEDSPTTKVPLFLFYNLYINPSFCGQTLPPPSGIYTPMDISPPYQPPTDLQFPSEESLVPLFIA
jgi:hypothetical protein